MFCAHHGIMTSCFRDGQAPKFVDKPSIKQMDGKIVMSVCVQAKPEPSVTWHKSSSVLTSSARIHIVSEKSATVADQYLLICEIVVSSIKKLSLDFFSLIAFSVKILRMHQPG